LLGGDGGADVGVYGADHTVVETGADSGAVEEDRVGVIYENGIAWCLVRLLVYLFVEWMEVGNWETHIFKHFVDGFEAGGKAWFVGAGHLVGDTW
jgi:hypothetical protein